ncbi:MAG TPA: hypothetical protein VFM21_09185, partial [Terriglobia bacterium]|nr:hypothetical protein [Terriglobia bacterium]
GFQHGRSRSEVSIRQWYGCKRQAGRANFAEARPRIGYCRRFRAEADCARLAECGSFIERAFRGAAAANLDFVERRTCCFCILFTFHLAFFV